MKQKYYIDEEEDSWLVKMYKLNTHWVNARYKNVGIEHGMKSYPNQGM